MRLLSRFVVSLCMIGGLAGMCLFYLSAPANAPQDAMGGWEVCYVAGSQNCPSPGSTCGQTKCAFKPGIVINPGDFQQLIDVNVYQCPGGTKAKKQNYASYEASADAPPPGPCGGHEQKENLGTIYCIEEVNCSGCDLKVEYPLNGIPIITVTCKDGTGTGNPSEPRIKNKPLTSSPAC